MTDRTTQDICPQQQPVPPATHQPMPADSAVPLAQPGQHRFLTGCLFVAILFLSGQWCWLSLQRPEPLPWHHGASFTEFFRVDINDATWVEWIQLQGIGETMAHRIVADRKINGPFGSIEDLLRVEGIGPKTLKQIHPWLTISHAPVADRPVEMGGQAHQQSGPH